MFKINKKIKKNKWFTYRQAGMTYVELIVVLTIFATMSSIAFFNYGKFQAKVEIKNLTNDIALKIVQAQKDAMSGKLPFGKNFLTTWKPSYGVYFNQLPTPDTDGISYNKKFIYFTDLDNSKLFNDSICASSSCLDKININRGDGISEIKLFPEGSFQSPTDLSIVFTRPNSQAIFSSNNTIIDSSLISYAEITISDAQGSFSDKIKIYPSGRIQITN